jgi:hypothetical protein
LAGLVVAATGIIGNGVLGAAQRQLWPGQARLGARLRDRPDRRVAALARLQDARWTGLYEAQLAAALAWLDRRWGAAGSARALGVCAVLALACGWAGFYAAYALGAPGRLGTLEWLPPMAPAGRAALALAAILLPALAWLLGRRLGPGLAALERAAKLAWLRRQRRRGRQGERWPAAWRFVLASGGVLAAVHLALLLPVALAAEGRHWPTLLFLLWAAWLGLGPAAGLAAARRVPQSWLKAPAALLAGAATGALATAGGLALAGVPLGLLVALSLAGAIAAAGSLAGTGALAILAAAALAAALTALAALTGMVLGPLAAAICLAAAAAGAIGTLGAAGRARRDPQGAAAGGIGSLLGLAAVVGLPLAAAGQAWLGLLVALLIALPAAGGLAAGASWWASRRLGRRLLARLDQGGPGWRAWVIGSHGLAGLLAALPLLALLALLLAFALEGWNQLAAWRSGTAAPAYDLLPHIRQAAAAPWSRGLWPTVLLLGVLAPVLLHGLLLLLSLLERALTGRARRVELAAMLASYPSGADPEAALQEVGWHLARSRLQAWLLAGGLTLALLLLLAPLLAAEGAALARAGVQAGRWLF